MQLVMLAVLCVGGVLGAVVLDEAMPVPIRLAGELPPVDDAIVVEYHVPIGVAEAARIKAAEAAAADEAAEQGEAADAQDGRPSAMIVGGLASYRGEHPFMAGLVITLTSGSTSVCGGSLVSATRVLTAASCYWDGVSQAYSMLVVLGSVTLFSGGTRVEAPTIVMHASYNPSSVHHNIALLTIPYQSSTSYVKPITLASGSLQYDGYSAEVIGYGRTSDTAAITTAASQRDVFVDVLTNAVCQSYYGSGVVAANVICSSGAGGRNPCGGDQGGPLILYSSAGNDLLIGVFAFGSTSGCSSGYPGGYMRLTYYYSWVLTNS